MEPGKNPSSRQNAKLLQLKDSVSPQILDYFKRFGQDRDLEQYFFTHGAPKSGESSSVRTDTTEFTTARCLNFNDDHSQCRKKDLVLKELASKNIDAEDLSNSFKTLRIEPYSPKNRSKLDDYITQVIEEVPTVRERMYQPKSPPKPMADSSDRSDKYIDMGDEEMQMDQSTAKAVSPGSSVTRKLEWDSLADVGYANAEHGRQSDQNLSTLERMALRSQYKYKDHKNDDKATPSQIDDVEMRNVMKMGPPNAQSTPETEKENTFPTYVKKQPPHTSSERKSNKTKLNKKSILKRIQNSGSYKLDYKISQAFSNVRIDHSKKFSFGLRDEDQGNQAAPNAYHMTDEQLYNVFLTGDKSNEPKKDLSPPVLQNAGPSDSRVKQTPDVSTSNKEIQTSHRGGISASAQTLQSSEDRSLSNLLSKTPIILNVLNTEKRKSAKKKRKPPLKSLHKLHSLCDKRSVESYGSGDEKSDDNFLLESPAKGSDSVLTRAESFEYMPAHMYLAKKIPSQSQTSQSIPCSSQGLASTVSLTQATISTESSSEHQDIFKLLERSSSFGRDLSSSIELISKLVNIRQHDPEKKRKLIKKVVQLLIKSDYLDDESSEIVPTSDSEKLTPVHDTKDKICPGKEGKIVSSPESDDRYSPNPDHNVFERSVEPPPEVETETKAETQVESLPKHPSEPQTKYQPKDEQELEIASPLAIRKFPFKRSLTADAPISEKLVQLSRPASSAPVSLTYADYLNQKAVSAHLDGKTDSEAISEQSAGVSEKISSNKGDESNDKDKRSTDESGRRRTALSTPNVSSDISDVQNKKLKSKSEEIYEKYLMALKEEEKLKEPLKLKDCRKKQKDLQLEKKSSVLTCQTNRNDTSSISSNTTHKQLAVINDEILQLTILKLQLENKHVPENLNLLNSDSVRSNLSKKMLKDEGASGDRGSFNNLSPALPNFQTPILGYYSVTNSQSSQKPSNYVHIPPLNLKKSSDDESCENTLSNVEDLNSGASTSKREVKIQSALSLPGHSSQRSFPSAHTNRTRGGNPSETSKNIKFSAGSISRGSNNEAQSDGTSREKQKPCKCGKIDASCCCKSPDSADHIHCKDSATGILCPCCRSNLVSSSSSLSDCNKPDVSSELRKLEKVFKKYQKCKILQSFMKEYDDLVMKYALSKEARLAKESQGLSRGSNVPGTSHQSKSTGKTPSHFNYSGTASGLTYIHKKSNICTQDEPKICKRKEVKILAHEESQVSLQQDLIAPTVYKQKESRLHAPEKSKIFSQRELNVYEQSEPTNYLQQQQKESTHKRDQPAVQRELTFRLPDQLLIDSQRGLNADSQRTPSPNSAQRDKQAHVTTVEKQLIDLYKESRTSRAESSQLSSKDSKSSGLLDVCLRSSLLVDATTSPFITPRQKGNNEEIACERKRSPRKKTSPPSSVNEDPCNPPGTGRTYVKSPHVSDHLIQKVRKAFSKEYEDIIKRYDDMRKEPCSKCERKWRCTADCSHDTNSPKINEVNVGNLPSSSNCDKKHDATASKTNADCEKKSKKDRRKEIICHKVCDLNEESEIYLCKENKRSKCEDKLNKDNKISEEKTGTTSNVVVCPLCKEAPITNDRNICCQCSKIQRKKFIADIIKKELSKRKPVPKPVAYNLIIEPSDCVIDEPSTRRMSLGEVIIKIPRQKKDKNKKNVQQALRASTIDGGSAEETSSTDDRIKLIFISNSDSSKDSSLTDPSSSAGVPDRNDGVPEQSLPKKYNLTLEEYLRKCRPNFIKNSEERQKELKNVHKLRQQKDVEIRKLFSLGVAGLPKLKQIQTQDLQFIANSHGIEIPKHGRTAFNSTEMVKNTARQYKKLPEIVCKKYEIKKKRDRKTNFLMADLFARKLKERTLKGCVNVSHSTNVISL